MKIEKAVALAGVALALAVLNPVSALASHGGTDRAVNGTGSETISLDAHALWASVPYRAPRSRRTATNPARDRGYSGPRWRRRCRRRARSGSPRGRGCGVRRSRAR